VRQDIAPDVCVFLPPFQLLGDLAATFKHSQANSEHLIKDNTQHAQRGKMVARSTLAADIDLLHPSAAAETEVSVCLQLQPTHRQQLAHAGMQRCMRALGPH
jgi:hypothetical protein